MTFTATIFFSGGWGGGLAMIVRTDKHFLVFWKKIRLLCDSNNGKDLCKFGKAWICESAISIVNFVKSQCVSIISTENLTSKLRCAIYVT